MTEQITIRLDNQSYNLSSRCHEWLVANVGEEIEVLREWKTCDYWRDQAWARNQMNDWDHVQARYIDLTGDLTVYDEIELVKGDGWWLITTVQSTLYARSAVHVYTVLLYDVTTAIQFKLSVL
jgi:hypothetical protein